MIGPSNALAAKPEHVPDAAVYDFDMYRDPALLKNPHARIGQMLKEAPPVFWTPRNNGHWVAIGHEAIFNASRDWDHFSSSPFPKEMMDQFRAMRQPGQPHMPMPVPITMDPPDHTKYRAPLATVFGPKAIKQREHEIRAFCASLLDAVKDKGQCDFIDAVAEPMPVTVFLKMMGLPVERLAEFRVMVRAALSPRPVEEMLSARQPRYIADALICTIRERKDDPRDDLISLLWKAEIDGQPMTEELMEDYAGLLFIAGLDTVINGIGYGVRHLAQNPALQDELRADPSKIRDALEELLRRYTFTIPARRIVEDVALEGWTLKQGEWLMLYLPGADLDARAFDSPETFDMKRQKAHIAFGAGPHRCIGSHLARLELQIAYEEVLARLPRFRLDPDNPPTFLAGHILSMASLPLRWD
jgi:cytochrome P450